MLHPIFDSSAHSSQRRPLARSPQYTTPYCKDTVRPKTRHQGTVNMFITCPYCSSEVEYGPNNIIDALTHVSACEATAKSTKPPAQARQQGNTITATEIKSPFLSSNEGLVGSSHAIDPDLEMSDSFDPPIQEDTHHSNSLPRPPYQLQIYPTNAQRTYIPVSCCATCEEDLSTYRSRDALQHRIACFYNHGNQTCPICEMHLSSNYDYLPNSVLHILKCHKGTLDADDPAEDDEFRALYESLCGRVDITMRFRKRQTGSRKRSAVQRKSREKWKNADGLYECGESPLRNSVSADGEEVPGWRTTGSMGKASRNMFPVVVEEYDSMLVD